MDSVKIYLMINRALYDSDEKNIAFALSFMKEGSAAIWASTFTKKALALTPPSLGTWTAFQTDFKTSFIHIDVKNEAIAWLTTASITKNLPLGDYISQFPKTTSPLAKSLMKILLSTSSQEESLPLS